MEFDNIETVKRAVEIDAGVAIVPQGTVVQEVAKQTLAQTTIEDGEFYRPLAAIYKKNKVLSPAMKEFLANLKEGNSRRANGLFQCRWIERFEVFAGTSHFF